MNIIEDDISMPEEVEKPKARTRAKRQSASNKAENPAASLIQALKFISVAQKKNGQTCEQFCHVAHNWVAACDGVVTAAHPIQEDLNACPNTVQFINALSKVESDISIVQLDATTLSVSSGLFRALISCVSFETVSIPPPDEACALIDDRLKVAIAAVHGLATEGLFGILLQSGTVVATNGSGLLEAWHGIDLPPNLLLPKYAAVAIAKCKQSLVAFGYSNSSATFYFENGAFIKTQLFKKSFPDYRQLFECENINLWPVPGDFFKAVHSVESFSKTGSLYFDLGAVLSSLRNEEASVYKIEGLPKNMSFSASLLLSVEHAFKRAFFDEVENRAIFYGDNIRGVISGVTSEQKSSPVQD